MASFPPSFFSPLCGHRGKKVIILRSPPCPGRKAPSSSTFLLLLREGKKRMPHFRRAKKRPESRRPFPQKALDQAFLHNFLGSNQLLKTRIAKRMSKGPLLGSMWENRALGRPSEESPTKSPSPLYPHAMNIIHPSGRCIMGRIFPPLSRSFFRIFILPPAGP